MEVFIKANAIVLIAVILCFILTNNKHFAMLITLGVCAMVGISAVSYLKPVISLMGELQALGGWNNSFFTILLKTVGIGILTEITVLVCNDSGNTALGKMIQMVGNAAMLWLALPLFTSLMELIKEILGGL